MSFKNTTSCNTLVLVGILALAGFLRLYHLSAQPLWVDEHFTIANLAVPWNRIVQVSASLNNAPPLYYIGLKFLHGVFNLPYSALSLRLPSVIAGVLSVYFLYLFVQRLQRFAELNPKGLSPAHIAAFLLAINPLHIWYSQDGRTFAIALLLLLACLVLHLEKQRIGLFVAIVALCAIHTQGFLVYPLLFVIACCQSPTYRTFLKSCISPSAPSFWIILSVPFSFMMLYFIMCQGGVLVHTVKRPFTGIELFYTLYTFVCGTAFGPSILELRTAIYAHDARAVILRYLPTLVTGCLATGAIFLPILVDTVTSLRQRFRTHIIGYALLASGFMYALAIEFTQPSPYHIRYTLSSLFGFIALWAFATSSAFHSRRKTILHGILLASYVIIASISLHNHYFNPRHAKYPPSREQLHGIYDHALEE